MSSNDNDNPGAGEQVLNAAKFVADTAVLPGISQLIEGQVVSGVVYGAVGLAAKAVFGPWLLLGVGLDSYSQSASGKHLWQLFDKPKGDAPVASKTIAEPANP
jgi:hypothetical protein